MAFCAYRFFVAISLKGKIPFGGLQTDKPQDVDNSSGLI